jgi:hypothetical protein
MRFGSHIQRCAAEQVLGRRTMKVQQGEVAVAGSFYAFGSDIQVLQNNSNNVDIELAYLRTSLDEWWSVTLPPGTQVKVKFNRPGIIAPAMSGLDISGATMTTQRILSIACSHPLSLSVLLAGGAANSFSDTAQAYWEGQPNLGIPGELIGVGSKLGTVAGAAGYTSLVAVAGLPVYVVATFSPARGTDDSSANNQMSTPIYLGAEFTTLPSGFPSTGTGFKIGDCVSFAQGGPSQIRFLFSCNHNVNTVGLWLPDAENSTGAVTAFSRWDVAVYRLRHRVTMPSSGGATGRSAGSLGGGLVGTPSGSGAGGSGVALVPTA